MNKSDLPKRSLFRKADATSLVANTMARQFETAKLVANAVANRSRDRHKDKDARRDYMRALMQRKRAEAKAK